MFQLRQYAAAGLLLVVTLASAADCGERRTTRVFPSHTELFQVVAPDYPWTQVTRAPTVLAPVSPPSINAIAASLENMNDSVRCC